MYIGYFRRYYQKKVVIQGVSLANGNGFIIKNAEFPAENKGIYCMVGGFKVREESLWYPFFFESDLHSDAPYPHFLTN